MQIRRDGLIHVAILDNDAMAGRMLGELLTLLDPAIVVDHRWTDGETAIDMCMALLQEGSLPDVLITDLEMPNIDGIEVTRSIRHVTSNMGILTITAFARSHAIDLVPESGAQGLLYKDSPDNELLSAIHFAACGKAMNNRFDDAEQAHRRLLAAASEPMSGLSPMQRKIVALCADGYATKQIARMLGIRESSVNEHIKRAMSKCNVHTRPHLIAVCLRKGLI